MNKKVEEIIETPEINEPNEPDYKSEYLDLVKVNVLTQSGLPLDKAEKYAKFIKGETEEEITKQAAEIVDDLTFLGFKGFVDYESSNEKPRKSKWNPFN